MKRFVFAFSAFAASLLLAAPASEADLQFAPGCLIQTTPFYQRLLAAGVFEAPIEHPSSPRPVILLFRIAHSFRYRSDKSGVDRWQSADETGSFYRGDCEDKAIWLYTQMRRNGYRDVALHIGKYGPTSARFHMWVTYVDDSGKTLLMDPTMQKKPWAVDAFPERNYKSMHIINGTDCTSF